ncbi:MAG: PEP-CTERM sorting domain-containing protein [Acidobacteriaceae bacterium]|nr:PEP-CTERM sorting domain-containing protein [Acidobacteriaceae bacterium]
MRAKVVALAAALVAAPWSLAFGSSFTNIVAFGDSLSDSGNASYLAKQFGIPNIPPSGYATRTVGSNTVGYYTNPQVGSGPSGLWVDQLAAKLGVADPAPAFIPGSGGTNFSLGGAETGGLNSMQTEVASFLVGTLGKAPASSLYTFWGGSNDLLNGGVNPATAANNIMGEIQMVAAAGGKYFLWVDLPPLGDTPGASGTPFAAALNAESAAFDQQWSSDIATLNSSGLTVIGVDAYSLFNQLSSNPGKYGFTNTTNSCITTAGCDPNTFLFWDDEHPTTETDSCVAGAAYNSLTGTTGPICATVATPEPASYALLMIGACGLFAMRRARPQR